jgi:hypothetical protein
VKLYGGMRETLRIFEPLAIYNSIGLFCVRVVLNIIIAPDERMITIFFKKLCENSILNRKFCKYF